MKLFELVKQQKTNESVSQITQFVGNNKKYFQELVSFFVKGNTQTSHTCSYAIIELAINNPDLLNSCHQKFIELLEDPSTPDGVRRNIARLYQTCIIPETIEGKLYDICIDLIINPKVAVAIKAYSMTVCERIALKYPDLNQELQSAIESTLPHASAGVKNRGLKILIRIQKKMP
ncbi:MAG: hypothetical protein P8P81_02470 [Bacteroidia bacterium]|nr:hypothetical protein [Bacteroidia bacterium]